MLHISAPGGALLGSSVWFASLVSPWTRLEQSRAEMIAAGFATGRSMRGLIACCFCFCRMSGKLY